MARNSKLKTPNRLTSTIGPHTLKSSMRFLNLLNINLFLIISLLSLGLYANSADQKCNDWFKEGNIKVGTKDCRLDCTTLSTDMRTFLCPNQCDSLCQISDETTSIGRMIYYPGLTQSERKLIEKYPKDALTVFVQKNRAESSSLFYFPNQELSDEGDAFRHFIWAGLLTKELGFEKAKEFLDAHENDPDQPISEQKMDIFNNSQGQEAALELVKQKNWSLEKLEQQGLEKMKRKQLEVLKPGLPIPNSTAAVQPEKMAKDSLGAKPKKMAKEKK